MSTNKPDLKDLIEKQCTYEGRKWTIEGITENALGVWIHLFSGSKMAIARDYEVEILEQE